MARGDLTNTQKQEAGTHTAALGAAYSWLEDIKNDLQRDFDDASEKWQESERGEEVSGLIDRLEDATATLEEICDLFDELSQGGN